VTRSDSPRPGDDKETDRDPPTPSQSPAEPLPEEDLEEVEEQPS
jgi:hypothetical protein